MVIQIETYIDIINKSIKLPIFENGFIILVSPIDYFEETYKDFITKNNLNLGENLLIFYQFRADWAKYNPNDQSPKLIKANSRGSSLGGQYIARIPGLTKKDGTRIILGYEESKPKGAGIRLFEYADSDTIEKTRDQLECLFWSCIDAAEVAEKYGMDKMNIEKRREYIFKRVQESKLWETDVLINNRMIDSEHITICPLCLKRLSANGFFQKEEQAEGRGVHNLTTTQLNLFHLTELRIGRFEHKTYNLGWGHHHCNTVVRDAGIIPTLQWMHQVVENNKRSGHNFFSKEEEIIELPQPQGSSEA